MHNNKAFISNKNKQNFFSISDWKIIICSVFQWLPLHQETSRPSHSRRCRRRPLRADFSRWPLSDWEINFLLFGPTLPLPSSNNLSFLTFMPCEPRLAQLPRGSSSILQMVGGGFGDAFGTLKDIGATKCVKLGRWTEGIFFFFLGWQPGSPRVFAAIQQHD